jgi:hypothetical protein
MSAPRCSAPAPALLLLRRSRHGRESDSRRRATRGGQSSGVTDQPQCRGRWHSSKFGRSRTGEGYSGGRKRGVVLGPSYFFISLVLGPLNSLVWYVPSLRYTRGLGWRIHCGVEVTESSTNKQHHHLQPQCTLLLMLHFFSPSFFHKISLSPVFTGV